MARTLLLVGVVVSALGIGTATRLAFLRDEIGLAESVVLTVLAIATVVWLFHPGPASPDPRAPRSRTSRADEGRLE